MKFRAQQDKKIEGYYGYVDNISNESVKKLRIVTSSKESDHFSENTTMDDL